MKRFVMLLAAALSVAGCDLNVPNPYGDNSEPSDPAKETFASSLNINIATMQKTEAGTYYKDVKEGTGATLSDEGPVVISYLGFLKNGAQFAGVSDLTIPVANLVGGLRDAMRGMKVGGERIIVVPSALGYGPGGFVSDDGRSVVPPNSTLVYDVILKNIP